MSDDTTQPRSIGRRKWDAIKNVLAWSGVAALAVSAATGYVAIDTARTAHTNTEKVDRSICAEVFYLENVISNPATDEANAQALRELVAVLRENSTECPLDDLPRR